mmetsp:Transcript_37965/g.27951  ORF Transcript_37965/g.27951 Transcript_37965/m.27951 type:complete len:240 (+) Transcript_37965:92-811(+)
MDDDWENEDFVPTLKVATSTVREEEDLLERELSNVSSAPRMTEEQKAKKAAEDEAAFMKKIEASKISEETADERRRRERLQVEEADHELTNELFQGMPAPTSPVPASGGSTPAVQSSKPKAAGLGGIPLNTNQDHFEFGNLVALRLQESTAFNVVAFYRGLSKLLKGQAITAENMDEITNEIKKIRDTKVKPAPGKKGEPAKTSAADKKKQAKKHEDTFGFSDRVSKYDEFDALEDDFM